MTMKLEQYKAIIDYCNDYSYLSKRDLLFYLKVRGVLNKNACLEDLAKKVPDDTYETMYNYLVGC